MGWCFLCPAFVAMRPGFQGLLLQHTGCPANSGMFTVSIFYRDIPQWPSYVWGCEWFMQGLGCLKKKKKDFSFQSTLKAKCKLPMETP